MSVYWEEDEDAPVRESDTSFARGMFWGLVFSLPVWAVVGLVIWLAVKS